MRNDFFGNNLSSPVGCLWIYITAERRVPSQRSMMRMVQGIWRKGPGVQVHMPTGLCQNLLCIFFCHHIHTDTHTMTQ